MGLASWVWMRSLTRSMGAVAVLAMEPEMPPCKDAISRRRKRAGQRGRDAGARRAHNKMAKKTLRAPVRTRASARASTRRRLRRARSVIDARRKTSIDAVAVRKTLRAGARTMARSVTNACTENSFFAGAMNCAVICWVKVGAGAATPTGFSTPRAANELAMMLWYMLRGRDISGDARTKAGHGRSGEVRARRLRTA